MKTTDIQKKETTLQFLIVERDKLLVACNLEVNDEYRLLYNSMVQQIARVTNELFEAKINQLDPTNKPRNNHQERRAR